MMPMKTDKGWVIDGDPEEGLVVARGPYPNRRAARAALASAREKVEARPYALLIERAARLASDLAHNGGGSPSCATPQESCGRRSVVDPQRMCGACAAYWHACQAECALRRVQAVEMELQAERDRPTYTTETDSTIRRVVS